VSTPRLSDRDAWLRGYHESDPGAVTLVCFPHAGGSASFFFALSSALAPAVAVRAVQYPGRQDRHREPCVDSIAGLADRISAALLEEVTGPLALFGHSMGAVLGYEVALRLCRAGHPGPRLLFASGRRAPSRYRPEYVHRGTDDQVLAVLRALDGTGDGLLADEEVARMILPAVRGDYRAIETYRHDPSDRLSCPVTVLTGADDPLTTLDEAQDWQRHTTGPTQVRVYPGGHFFLVPQAAAVIGEVRAGLSGLTLTGGPA
jgi:surfactin synthase thioesterase subunit